MNIFYKLVLVLILLPSTISYSQNISPSIRIIDKDNAHLLPRSDSEDQKEIINFNKNYKGKQLSFQGIINQSQGLSLGSYYVHGCETILHGLKKGSMAIVSGNLVSRESGGSGGEPIELEKCYINSNNILASKKSTSESLVENNETINNNAKVEISAFNLKGFHLNMSRNDVKKLIPNAKFEAVNTIDGKEFSGYQCGVIVRQSPSACNFTYAGEEITAISVVFWGEKPTEIQLYFGEYRPGAHKPNVINLEREMRTALDTKYPKESNSAGPGGRIGSRWKSGNEYILTEFVRDKNFYSNSISLADLKYRAQMQSKLHEYNEQKNKIDKSKNDNKKLSDM